MRAVAAAALALSIGATACDETTRPRFDPPGFASMALDLTVTLAGDVPTFKVDGRLRLVWDPADQPVGGRDLGIVVLPAGERTASFEIQVPTDPGRLVIREETVSARVPFLCGSSGHLNPRQTRSVTVVLELCQPE